MASTASSCTAPGSRGRLNEGAVLASFRQIREAYNKAARDSVKDLANIVLERGNAVIQEEAIDRGDLLSSGEVEVEKERPRAVVKWTAKHAIFVHYGTRPHWPPLEPILAWVRRNLARYTNTSGNAVDAIRPSGRVADRTRKSPDAVIMRVARAIQAKIAREGTSPVPFALKGAAEAKARAPTILRDNLNNRLKGM